MGLAGALLAVVRGRAEPSVDQVQGQCGALNVNSRGDLLVAQALSPKAELVRMRNSYQALAVTAVAPVTALPTTAALLSIFNNELDNGKVYIIDSLIAHVVVSAGAATNVGMCAMLNAGQVVAPTDDATIVRRGLAGQKYKGQSIILAGATVVDGGWHPIGNAVIGPASQICMNVDVPVDGLFVVPPGHYFSISVLANTAGSITVRAGFRWHEVQLPVG